MIRKVEFKDAESIAKIYNYYVENTVITFEEIPVTPSDMQKRLINISKNYPFLVLEIDDELIGYAYVTEWKLRSAYKFSAELTIYLDHEKTGMGYGSILFSALLVAARKTHLHALVGGIALPNGGSIALHEKFGFKKIAQFEQIGFKFGHWVDVGYWELII